MKAIIQGIGQKFMFIDRSFRHYMKVRFSELNLDLAEGMILLVLFEGIPVTQEYLATVLTMDKSAIARSLANLCHMELASRVVNPEDRRSKLVVVTEKGLAHRQVVFSMLKSWSDRLFAGLDDNAVLNVNETLDGLISNLKDI